MVTLYALILNVESLSGDIFINFVLGALIEVPSQLIVLFLVDITGKLKTKVQRICYMIF